jgi:EAL domain-containing protein (putative c-di-GMP-specific phosphodiesterase class I)
MHHDSWHLEGYFSGDSVLGRLAINLFPFQIGREAGIGFTVHSSRVSRIHAEITCEGDRLYLTDNGSTNGTFVNRVKIEGKVPLQHGDVLHFADFEVRLIKETVKKSATPTLKSMTVIGMPSDLSDKMPAGIRELQELIENKMVVPAYQPIIECATQDVHAYEILGRGTHPALSRNPGPLFHIAESVGGLAMHLSGLFRDAGVAKAATFDTTAKFFLNIHPDELKYVRLLLLQMERVRKLYPHLRLVLEIHEKAVTSMAEMKKICRELDNLDIELAYDDFGAGQARFIELIEAPAHYLKFDISLVREIDKATVAKRNMVRSLVSISKDMSILTLAEGLDRQEEVEVCKELGFDFIQGFYYGKPTEGSIKKHSGKRAG